MAAPTNRESDKFMLRLPNGMRERIKTAAEAANRSMNSEIVAALERAYPPIDADHIELATFIDRFRASKDHEERRNLARSLQGFLRATGSSMTVAIDGDEELLLRK